MNLLDVKNLEISFCSRGIRTPAVKGVDFSVGENESVAIVGVCFRRRPHAKRAAKYSSQAKTSQIWATPN